jgi:signal transduction histidine kinase
MPEERVPNELAFGLLVISGSWLLGLTLSHRIRRVDGALAAATRLTAEQRTLAIRMLAEERTRIARELHDVIAHGVSVMGVQCAAARVVLDHDPDNAKQILLAVESQARESIGELQRLLSVLRAADDGTVDRRPQPGLGDLSPLFDTMRGAGLKVTLTVRGEARHLPPGADLTAYRIVQEALTNTLRHAGPVAVTVNLYWAPDELRIEVANQGPPVAESLLPGHGLLGMRERTALYGGSLVVAGQPSGGVTVNANLPLAAVNSQ